MSCNAIQGNLGEFFFSRSRWKLASLSSSKVIHFNFHYHGLILTALVSIKELEDNQENSSSTVMVAFYLRVVA